MNTPHRLALLEYLGALESVQGIPVYWTTLPQDTPLPAVRLSLVSDVRGASHSGDDLTSQATIQVDVFADDPNKCQEVRDAIIDALHGYSGPLSGAFFEVVLHDSSRESIDTSGSYSASADFTVTYQR